MRTIQNEMTKKETKAKTCTSLAGKKRELFLSIIFIFLLKSSNLHFVCASYQSTMPDTWLSVCARLRCFCRHLFLFLPFCSYELCVYEHKRDSYTRCLGVYVVVLFSSRLFTNFIQFVILLLGVFFLFIFFFFSLDVICSFFSDK